MIFGNSFEYPASKIMDLFEPFFVPKRTMPTQSMLLKSKIMNVFMKVLTLSDKKGTYATYSHRPISRWEREHVEFLDRIEKFLCEEVSAVNENMARQIFAVIDKHPLIFEARSFRMMIADIEKNGKQKRAYFVDQSEENRLSLFGDTFIAIDEANKFHLRYIPLMGLQEKIRDIIEIWSGRTNNHPFLDEYLKSYSDMYKIVVEKLFRYKQTIMFVIETIDEINDEILVSDIITYSDGKSTSFTALLSEKSMYLPQISVEEAVEDELDEGPFKIESDRYIRDDVARISDKLDRLISQQQKR